MVKADRGDIMPQICPQCGLENSEEAKFCISCGTALANVAAGMPSTQQYVPPTTVVVPVAIKEGFVPVKRQHVGMMLVSSSFVLLFCFSLISFFTGLYIGTEPPQSLFIWGSKVDYYVRYYATAPIWLAIILAIAVFFLPRVLQPRIYGFAFGKAGKARKKFKDRVKREFGVYPLFKRSTYLPFVIVSMVLALAILAIIIVDIFIMRGEGYQFEAGFFISLVLACLYFLSLQLMWPSKRNRVVKMDSEGRFL